MAWWASCSSSAGGATQFAIFALGIMPYITASIIMQILTVVIPKLEEWQQMGAVGHAERANKVASEPLNGRHNWPRAVTVVLLIGGVLFFWGVLLGWLLL